MEREKIRDRLLLASLPHVVFDGWTDTALRAGATDCGMEPIAVRRFFPRGVGEAIEHFSDWADRRMMETLVAHDLSVLRLREKVALAVKLRLEVLAPYREVVRRTFSFLALPTNLPLGACCLYRTVDAVWYAVGDRSADFNFYTKRALLAAVVSSTTLYWLDDNSDENEASWSFLDRRIADVMAIPALRSRFEKFAERLPDPFAVLRAARSRTRRPTT